jgi:hypothetical protein
VDTPQSVLRVPEPVERWLVESDLSTRLRAVQAQPTGGCNACRFADPLSDRLCTIPDISAEDFDLGVSGINCSRFAPYEAV